jgi:hypothetical protein
MNSNIKILAAAHSAACQEAMFQVKTSEQYEPDPDAPGTFRRVNPTPAKVRAAVLNLLVELGFPRCIVENDEDECVTLKPMAQGSDSDDEGGWSAWMAFSKAEYLAYCEVYGDENYLDDTDDAHEGDVCQCGGTIRRTYGRRSSYRCVECGDCYDDPGARLANLAAQLGGFSAYSSGPGRPFSHGGWADVGRTRILVKASGGLDI